MPEQNRKIRVALIGAGTMANRYHYPSLATFPDVELAAVCDLVPEKAQETAARFNIPSVYSDYQKMLEEINPEAVWVLMPPQHLFGPVSHALKQGRHVFIEKPLAFTIWQARLLAYWAQEYNCLTMVGFQRRHIPAITDFKRRVEERSPIHHASVSFLKSSGNYDGPAGHSGGEIDSLWSDGVHAVDNLRWLCGGEVVDVHATVRTRYAPGPMPNEYLALITFSTGAVGILQSSYCTGRRIFRQEFHGRSMTAYVDADADSYLIVDGEQVESRPSKEWAASGGAAGDKDFHWLGFWHENRHFVDCLQNGTLPTSHFGDALKSMELLERIYQAGYQA